MSKFSYIDIPYIKEIMAIFDDGPAKVITIKKGAAIGKTEASINHTYSDSSIFIPPVIGIEANIADPII